MDASRWTRRDMLGRGAFATASAAALTWLGRLQDASAGEPGESPVSGLATGTIQTLAYEDVPGFLSREQVGLHHSKHYAGALKALTDIEGRLYAAEGVTDKAARRELGRAQSEKANSVLLHELYFRGLSPTSESPAEDLRTALAKRFGSLDRWRADLEACALVANGWAMLAVHPINGRLYHVVSDAHDVGPLWLARPLAIIDMYEHAYYVDYKSDKSAYVKGWFDHIDWAEAGRRWKAT